MDMRSTVLNWQDEGYVREILDCDQQMLADRAPWDSLYRRVERRVDPVMAGGFDRLPPGGARGLDNFDSTAMEGLERYVAAIGGLLFPRNQIWALLTTTSDELNKSPAVQRWLEYATRRLQALRYAPAAGFETQIHEDIRSGGIYGTAPLWVDEIVGYSMMYKAIHLSEIRIGENYCGRVDTVHREYEKTARQISQEFPDSLSPKMEKAIRDKKPNTMFRLLEVVRPNESRSEYGLDWRGKPIERLVVDMDDRWILRRGGNYSMPMLVSRTSTSPRDKYGRSPAMRVLGTILGANEMAKTILKAGHKAVDPPILFADDGRVSKFSSKPGGLNPGMVDDQGRILAHPFQTGGNLPVGIELLNAEREVIKNAFLDKAFSLLMERGDRMTATEVLELAKQQGMLVAPTAGRMETEKLGPLIARELDIGLRSGQILQPPPELQEATRARQAGIKVIYDNPMSRMARAEEASGFTRWVEIVTQIAQFDPDVIDLVDTEASSRGLAEVLGVRPSWISTPEQVAAKRQAREQAKQQQSLLEGAPALSQAALNLSKANQLANAA